MWACYLLVQNFGVAIIIFTLLVKLAMLPLALKQQKNMAQSQLFAPKVKEIQTKYRNNREKQAEEMQKLQSQGYNPMGGCGPMLLTMILLFGVIDVVYKPMTHMEHMDSTHISNVLNVAKQTEIAEIFLNGYNGEDKALILEYKGDASTIVISDGKAQVVTADKDTDEYKNNYAAKNPAENGISSADRETYGSFADSQLTDLTSDTSRLSAESKARVKSVITKYSSLQRELVALQTYQKYPSAFDTELITIDDKDTLNNLGNNMNMFGINLGETPAFAFNALLIVPILSFLFSLAQMIITQWINKKTNPAAAEMGGSSMKIMLYIMPFFSLWIAFQVPAGVGFYWTISYAIGIIQSLLLFKFYHPEKLKAEAQAKLDAKSKRVTTTAVVVDSDETTDDGKKKKVVVEESLSQKELNRRKLAAARKADAEKYGEEYTEDDSDK